jgi:hypothetical protein
MGQPPVRNIVNRLGDGAKSRGGFDPPRWQRKRNSNERFFAGTRVENNGKLGRRVGGEPNLIKTVPNIDLVHVHWPVFWIGMAYAKQQPVQSAAKLHRFGWCELQRVHIDTVK